MQIFDRGIHSLVSHEAGPHEAGPHEAGPTSSQVVHIVGGGNTASNIIQNGLHL